MGERTTVFNSSTERTAWSIAARHLARGQNDPVEMVLDGIKHERERCIALLQAAGLGNENIPLYLRDPDTEW